jgi:hypothetical protein
MTTLLDAVLSVWLSAISILVLAVLVWFTKGRFFRQVLLSHRTPNPLRPLASLCSCHLVGFPSLSPPTGLTRG